MATRRLVKRIVCVTIETGVITSTYQQFVNKILHKVHIIPAGVSILCFVLLAVSPHSGYYMAVMLSLTKLYTITLLFQLKNRAKLLHELENLESSMAIHM